MIENKKASILLVLKTLEEYSDANHYLTQQEIINKISTNYGIELERKSIGNSISLLQELDYDIVKGKSGGFALFERVFDEAEAKFLIDAIFSSKSISGNRAKELANKVSAQLSRYNQKSYQYLTKSENLNRTKNKEVFYNIEVINEAIRENKWISFQYLSYDENGARIKRYDGYVYHASPCYLVNNFGKYYLLAYRPKHDSVLTWRVDNMVGVQVFDERERLDPKTLKEFADYDSISDYLNDHIYLFGGKPVRAEVELKHPEALAYIEDWFGENASISKVGDKLHAFIKCDEQALFYWVMQYNEHIVLLSPESLKDRVKQAAKDILATY